MSGMDGADLDIGAVFVIIAACRFGTGGTVNDIQHYDQIADALERLNPREDPDGFAETVRRIKEAAFTESSIGRWLNRLVYPLFGDDARKASSDMATGRMMPTPKFRQEFISRVKECLDEAKPYIDTKRASTPDASG